MTKNDHYFIDEAENNMGRCLVLTAPWSNCLKSVIEKENISVLRLSQSAGWKGDDISFLKDLSDLRGVEVYAWNVKDLTPLQYIVGLEYLGIQCGFTKAPIFSDFKKLKICKLLWRPKAKTIFDCTGLSLLNIVNYPSEDLQDIKSIGGLERLQITSIKLTSLSGIESLSLLSNLDLAECSSLESISGIEECQQLNTVELEKCKKVNDISCLGELVNLRNVVLTDCGKIKSLRPLSNCQLLESLTFIGDTDIEDGDLTPLLEIPKLKQIWFADRRHYSHKRDMVIKWGQMQCH